MRKDCLFTSESVSEGHPDKVCDQISDAVVDELLKRDPETAKVACETLVKDNKVLLAGEVQLRDRVKLPNNNDYEKLVRRVVAAIGYTDAALGFCADTCEVSVWLGEQSPDIKRGVDKDDKKEQGAGDQGLMFGYATNETDQYMPAPIHYAHRLMKRHAEVRKSGQVPWLRPDAKSQLTLRYRDGKPQAITAVVISTQHDDSVELDEIRATVQKEIIFPVLEDTGWLSSNTKYHINPTGKFVIGGPCGDCGVTGRKIIVDTYGGMARHGGGAFSGKDPSKVDRSAAYMARYIAKNIVAAELARRCEIQVSYAIGVNKPVSIDIDTFGTGKISEERIEKLVEDHFDLTPYGIISALRLKRPIYLPTATYGHFGRDEFPWEQCDKVSELLNAL